MYTVTNRIKVKKGLAKKMAPLFTQPGPLLTFKGFRKVEVLVSTQFEDYDEMNVVMYWDSLEEFEAWRASDAFKEAHKRPSGNSEEAPTLENVIVISEVVSTLENN
ncbi:heme oxygenase [Ureibacillus thermosphaericus]|uniref:Heme oxygenase (Staphylobilin-producing) n=1 Tax=Ureibacillus thermosphaericus TaxID=51173 RepID=A0A840PXC4_URETH|nr:heme oxygenase [Ureibacillus thermosphaericus]MBB5149974.1 heme oxygenase (staphylobilin-producing) [Ureibacillus thermosphaericus]NKZ31758.1 heme oxygenase [Ureibacillus thermosphaericus]